MYKLNNINQTTPSRFVRHEPRRRIIYFCLHFIFWSYTFKLPPSGLPTNSDLNWTFLIFNLQVACYVVGDCFAARPSARTPTTAVGGLRNTNSGKTNEEHLQRQTNLVCCGFSPLVIRPEGGVCWCGSWLAYEWGTPALAEMILTEHFSQWGNIGLCS